MPGAGDKRSWGNIALLAGFGIAAGMMVALIGASFLVPPMVNGWVERYTEAVPMAVAREPIPAQAKELVEDRVDAFLETPDTPSGPRDRELVLTEEDLRALIDENDSDGTRVGMALQFGDGTIRSAVSIPIAEDVPLGPWVAKTRGRYFNGYATFRVAFRDGALDLTLDAVETPEGESLPGWATAALQRELDDSGFLESEEVREALGKLSGLEVREGALVLRK